MCRKPVQAAHWLLQMDGKQALDVRKTPIRRLKDPVDGTKDRLALLARDRASLAPLLRPL